MHLADVLIQGDFQRECSKISLNSLITKTEPIGRSLRLFLDVKEILSKEIFSIQSVMHLNNLIVHEGQTAH